VKRKKEMLVKKTLKKYPNRRLYDTESSVYVTLSDVAQMVRNGHQVEVVDAKTGEDVTAFILMQVVSEQTKNNHIILPSSLLHLIIRFGENTLSEFFEKYLEKSIQSYLSYKKIMDEQFRIYMELGMDFSSMAEKTLKNLTPFSPFYKEDSGETDAKD
jgi:polyhydroxyalkanoate synthesis repressor PhaR